MIKKVQTDDIQQDYCRLLAAPEIHLGIKNKPPPPKPAQAPAVGQTRKKTPPPTAYFTKMQE